MVLAGWPGAEPAFTRACAEVSGGNPFLARELLKTLLADGIVPSAGSVSRVRSLLPDSVLHSALVRLGRLGEPAGRLARAVAVLGDRASLGQARRLADLDAEPVERAADALAGARILAPGEPLSFTHPLIATSVLADIPAFARSRAHRRAAGPGRARPPAARTRERRDRMRRRGRRGTHRRGPPAAVPPYLAQTEDNPDGPLPAEAAEQMLKGLTEDRDGFFDQFTTQFFSAGGQLKVTEAQRQEALELCRQSDQTAAVECMKSFGTTDFRADLAAWPCRP